MKNIKTFESFINEASLNLNDVKKELQDLGCDIESKTSNKVEADHGDTSANITVYKDGKVEINSTYDTFTSTIKNPSDLGSVLSDFENWYEWQKFKDF